MKPEDSATLMVRSANHKVSTLTLNLLIYRGDAWCMASFRYRSSCVHENNKPGEGLRLIAAACVEDAFEHLEKYSDMGRGVYKSFSIESLNWGLMFASIRPSGAKVLRVDATDFNLNNKCKKIVA
jgi:hypothetical protein